MTSTYGNGNSQEPQIKPDPDSLGGSPAAQDEDVYEDAGDLDFSGTEPGLYLTRIPKFLWERWSKLDDNQEVQIGTLRVEGNLGDIKRVLSTSCSVRHYWLLKFFDADESYIIAGPSTKPRNAKRVQHASHKFRHHQHLYLHRERSTWLPKIYA